MKIFNCTPKRIAAVIDTNTNVVEGKILDKPTKFVWEPWQFLDIPNDDWAMKILERWGKFYKDVFSENPTTRRIEAVPINLAKWYTQLTASEDEWNRIREGAQVKAKEERKQEKVTVTETRI